VTEPRARFKVQGQTPGAPLFIPDRLILFYMYTHTHTHTHTRVCVCVLRMSVCARASVCVVGGGEGGGGVNTCSLYQHCAVNIRGGRSYRRTTHRENTSTCWRRGSFRVRARSMYLSIYLHLSNYNRLFAAYGSHCRRLAPNRPITKASLLLLLLFLPPPPCAF
jgi:hypothetical protein